MRTNIDIDDAIMREAMAATGAKTKREAVHEALETVVRLRKQSDFLKFRGKINWVGDLDEMRRD